MQCIKNGRGGGEEPWDLSEPASEEGTGVYKQTTSDVGFEQLGDFLEEFMRWEALVKIFLKGRNKGGD